MANAITLAKEYIALLDKAYAYGAKTSVLDVAPALVKAGANAGEFNLQRLALVGLGNYSKTDGPPAGDVTATWETHSYSYDRGRKFTVDAVDDLEAMGVFANVASEFIRRYVTPEVDAVRMAVLATAATSKVDGDLDTATDWVDALNVAMNTLDDYEVPEDDRILFITGAGRRLVTNAARDAATTDALDRCTVVTIPQGRFYTTCTLDAGATASAGGFTNAGHKINFMVVDKSSCFTDAKHTSVKVFTPEENQTSDGYMFHYRLYHDAFPYAERVNGIYVQYEDAVS